MEARLCELYKSAAEYEIVDRSCCLMCIVSCQIRLMKILACAVPCPILRCNPCKVKVKVNVNLYSTLS